MRGAAWSWQAAQNLAQVCAPSGRFAASAAAAAVQCSPSQASARTGDSRRVTRRRQDLVEVIG